MEKDLTKGSVLKTVLEFSLPYLLSYFLQTLYGMAHKTRKADKRRDLVMEKDLTKGSVLKTVLEFSLPYLLSYFLQTLYGMADLFIIGQYNGVESITAVSVGSQVMHMLTVMIVGLAMGATIMIGRAVGAGKRKEASLAIGNTVTLFMALSAVLTAGLFFAAEPIAILMSTPAGAVRGAVTYLKICFVGIPFITAYNIISSIFRGMGDSKSPMYFVAAACAANIALDYLFIGRLGMGPFITAYNIISSIFRGMGDSKSPMYFVAAACAANIALDYLFIGRLGMGPAGAALGTVLSQTFSVAVSLFLIARRKMGITLEKEDFKPDRKAMPELLRIGIPVALQDGFIQISFIIITVFANRRGLDDAAAVGIVEKIIGILFLVPSSMLQTVSALSAQNIGAITVFANRRGLDDAAAVGIVEKIIGILFLVPSSMLQTVSALSAQNIGAGRRERARKTLFYAAAMSVVWGAAACFLMQLRAEDFVGMFAGDSEKVVLLLGSQYMKGYVWDCILAGIHFSFSGYFCACGLSGLSFLHNSLSILCVRIPLSYFASKYFMDTLFPMGLASPAGSAFSAVFCIAVFIWIERRKNDKNPVAS